MTETTTIKTTAEVAKRNLGFRLRVLDYHTVYRYADLMFSKFECPNTEIKKEIKYCFLELDIADNNEQKNLSNLR